MKNKNERPDDAANLRRQAEETVRKGDGQSPEDPDALSSDKMRYVLHELSVHQIELEMQNEELRRVQQERENSRALYFDLYDLAPVGYVTINEKGLIKEANLTVAALVGVAKAALVKQTFSRFIFREDQDAYYRYRKQFFESHSALRQSSAQTSSLPAGESHALELRMVRAGATPFWARMESVAAQDPDGEQVVRVAISDITRHRTVEQALNVSETRYRRLFETAQDGILILDADSGLIKDVNPFLIKMLGYTREEIVDRKLWEMGFFRDVQKSREAFQRLKTEGYVRYEDLPLERKDGTVFDVEFVSNVYRVDHARVIQCNIRDITDRKRIEDTLRFLAQTGGTASGDDFFDALARHLARSLGMNFVCIDRLQEGSLTAQTVAVYFDGKFEDNVSYTLKDTPCGDVVDKSTCCFPRDVRRMFPKDQVLQRMSAESYVGTILKNAQGQCIGLIAVIGQHPLLYPELAESILQLVAVRASVELERRRARDILLASNVELTRFNNVAVDRELRMIELKREINELCAQTGQKKRYPLEFDEKKTND